MKLFYNYSGHRYNCQDSRENYLSLSSDSLTRFTMRIIGGKFRGLRLKGPGSKNTFTRPMLDRVRESLFNILGEFPRDKNVLDLCAGTGSLGLEALSRGAKSAVFIEKSAVNVRTIRANIAHLDVGSQCHIINGSLPKILHRLKSPFGLILFDPPFPTELADEVLPEIHAKQLLAPDGLVVIERSKRHKNLAFDFLDLERTRALGDSVLWIFRSKS